MSFEIYQARLAGAELTQTVKSLPNTLYTIGDMGYLVNGQFTQVSAGSKATHILLSMKTNPNTNRPLAGIAPNQFQSSSQCEDLLVACIEGNEALWFKTYLTGVAVPVINLAACNTNASTTSVLITAGGAAGDSTGGVIYVAEFGQSRLITNDAYSAGVHTYTINTPFLQGQTAVAATAGNTATVLPFGPGVIGIKFNATTSPQFIDTTVAGKTGGYLKCEEVHFEDRIPYVLLSAPYLQ